MTFPAVTYTKIVCAFSSVIHWLLWFLLECFTFSYTWCIAFLKCCVTINKFFILSFIYVSKYNDLMSPINPTHTFSKMAWNFCRGFSLDIFIYSFMFFHLLHLYYIHMFSFHYGFFTHSKQEKREKWKRVILFEIKKNSFWWICVNV